MQLIQILSKKGSLPSSFLSMSLLPPRLLSPAQSAHSAHSVFQCPFSLILGAFATFEIKDPVLRKILVQCASGAVFQLSQRWCSVCTFQWLYCWGCG